MLFRSAPEEEAETKIIDIMEALKASLKTQGKGKSARAAPKKAKAAPKKAKAKTAAKKKTAARKKK